MSKLVLWFVKLTGFIPQIFYFRKKVYYVNKKVTSRKIKGSAILVSNHKRLFDFALYMYLFLGRDIYTVIVNIKPQTVKTEKPSNNNLTTPEKSHDEGKDKNMEISNNFYIDLVLILFIVI